MKKVRLGDFIEKCGDGIHGTPIYNENGEYYFINGNNLSNGEIEIDETTLMISSEEYEKIKRPLGRNTILLSINGTLGKIAEYRGEKIALGKSACYLNVKNEEDKVFVEYVLSTQGFKKYIQNVAHGSTIKNLAPTQVLEYEFPLPENIDIRKTSAILKALDDKIKLNYKISAELEALAKTIYDYWFLQFEFPNDEGKPYKSSGGKMVWSEELKREIPEGWGVERLGNHINFKRGISYNSTDIASDDGYPMLNLNSFNPDYTYKTSGLKLYSGIYTINHILQPHDLVVAVTQQTSIDLVGDTDVIGKGMIVPDIFDRDVVFSMDVIKIVTDNVLDKYYLYMLFKQKFYRKHITGFANGTKIKHLDISGILEYKFVIPDERTLRSYSDFIEKCTMRNSLLLKENLRLTSLRDYLLPLLMNGQVRFEE